MKPVPSKRILYRFKRLTFIFLFFSSLLILPVCHSGSTTSGENASGADTVTWVSRGGKNYGIFAPEEAWLEGDSLPYFGSENEWSRRMFEKEPADRFYKRRGQRQLLAILDGEPARAEEYCRQRIAEDPADPEPHYMLTLAYCAMAVDDPSVGEEMKDKAEESMARAIELGMPFGRFIAGPRELLGPIMDGELYKELLYGSSPLVHGPMLGYIRPGAVSCWVRTADESAVQMKAWEVPDATEAITSARARTTAERDYTAVLELGGLEPGTRYQYNILVDGKPMFPGEDLPTFTTGVPAGEPGTFKVAFGGGAGHNPEAEKIWNTILDNRPGALFLLGDNVYVDLPEMPGAFHDYTYYCRYSRPEFRSLTGTIPVYTIWDDHDAGIDDIWMGPYREKPEWKIPMVRHYQRNWVNPGYGTEEWPGCWYSFTHGDIEFFMLDGRTYRTCPFGPDPTILGPVQKKWLLTGLQRSTASVKVLVSPVPWNFLAKPGSHDTWAGFQEERDEIFSLIAEKSIDGVVLMSADRHRSEVWEVQWEGPYPLYEFLSSRLTNMHFHDIVPGAIFSFNDPQSFGMLEFNTEKVPPSVKFQVVNLRGEEVYDSTFTIGR